MGAACVYVQSNDCGKVKTKEMVRKKKPCKSQILLFSMIPQSVCGLVMSNLLLRLFAQEGINNVDQ